jgi:hypothetical protein
VAAHAVDLAVAAAVVATMVVAVVVVPMVVAAAATAVADTGNPRLGRKIAFPLIHEKSPLASASGLFVCARILSATSPA